MKIGNLLSTGITLFSLVVLLSILSNVISKIGKQTNLSNKGFSHAPSLIASLRKPNNNKRSSKSRRASKRTGSPKAKKSKLTTGDNSRIITLLNDNTDSMNIKVKVVKKGKVIQLRKGFITNITCNEDSFEKQLYTIRCEKCNCSGPHIRGVSCSNGWCNCEPGYTGKKCQDKCSFGLYGEGCDRRCKCDTMGIESCDHISGKCNCKDGIYGQQCEKAPCICNGPNTVNGSCNSKGYCFCKPGFNGHKCDDMCKGGEYGQDCKKYIECSRENIRSYNHINGKCTCKTEWEGQWCERIKACKAGEYRPYTYGEYPKKCQKCNCTGPNMNSQCSHTGCDCKPGYQGKICDEKCDDNYFGDRCASRCECIYNNTESCHHIQGYCECKVGFRGFQCDKST